MADKVSVTADNGAYSRYMNYLSRAQESLSNAATLAADIPAISAQRTEILSVRNCLGDLRDDTCGALNQLVGRDSENAASVYGGSSDDTRRTWDKVGSGALGVLVSSSLSKDFISYFVKAGHGSHISTTKGFVFELLDSYEYNMNHVFSWSKVLGSNKRNSPDSVIKRFLKKDQFWQNKSGVSEDALLTKLKKGYYKNQKLRLTKDFPTDKLDKQGYSYTKSHYSNQDVEKIAGKAVNTSSKTSKGFIVKATLKKAALSGFAGALFSGGLEALSGYNDYKNGTITGNEYNRNVVSEAAGGFASAAVSTAVTGVLAAGVLSFTLPGVAAAAVGIAAGVAVGWAVSTGVSWLWNKLSH